MKLRHGAAGICAIVLAAGASTRFGSDKRLAPIGGRPMLRVTALRVQQAVHDTLVVLGPEDRSLAHALVGAGIASTHCPEARLGMGHSLAHGVAQRPDAAGWLIVPGDMPFIALATMRALMECAPLHRLAAPVYQGRRGHPVWFARDFQQELLALEGDEGGRSILKRHGPPCLIEVDDAGCVRDVDRPQDLALPY